MQTSHGSQDVTSNHRSGGSSHIQAYWRELEQYRRQGADSEGTVSQAFAALLKCYANDHKLTLLQQYTFPLPEGVRCRPDGALRDALRLTHGWWEAKDAKDDLDKEIAAKLAKGYPSDNIIFEDTITAVLYQDGKETARARTDDTKALGGLLDNFFDYLPKAVLDFRTARDQFRRDTPNVAAGLREAIEKAAKEESFRLKRADFIVLCRTSINPSVTEQHVNEMLIQHILTEQLFSAVFPSSEFHRANHIARAISELELSFLRGDTRANLMRRMEPYYAAIRIAAAGTVNADEKQDFLREAYEDFYAAYNAKDADRLGVVYTPAYSRPIWTLIPREPGQ